MNSWPVKQFGGVVIALALAIFIYLQAVLGVYIIAWVVKLIGAIT
jgi:hypothetical protein